MKPLSLRKLLETNNAAILLSQFAKLAGEAVTLVIFDQRGRVLAAYPSLEGDRLAQAASAVRRTGQPLANGECRALPILVQDRLLGVVAGAPPSVPGLDALLDSLLAVISMLVAQAIERKSLAQELLARYREINLLYRVHETIGAHIDLNQVAAHALTESVRIVEAGGGALFLGDEITGELGLLAAEGNESELCDCRGIPQWVAQEGRPAIVNDVSGDLRHIGGGPALRSLLCVPLKIREKSLGALCLCNKQRGNIFTAGDEKLLLALASPTAVAIENARQVAARERQLRQQIQELRIKVDQVQKRQAVKTIVDSDYFRQLAEMAQQWRDDLEA